MCEARQNWTSQGQSVPIYPPVRPPSCPLPATRRRLGTHLEAVDVEFAKAFWDSIEGGGYEIAQRSTGAPAFYRFLDPAVFRAGALQEGAEPKILGVVGATLADVRPRRASPSPLPRPLRRGDYLHVGRHLERVGGQRSHLDV
jgi:hypothetical protein